MPTKQLPQPQASLPKLDFHLFDGKLKAKCDLYAEPGSFATVDLITPSNDLRITIFCHDQRYAAELAAAINSAAISKEPQQ